MESGSISPSCVAPKTRSGKCRLTESRVQVTKKNGYVAFESADGVSLYYLKERSGPLWKMPLGGGPETQVLDFVVQKRLKSPRTESTTSEWVRRGSPYGSLSFEQEEVENWQAYPPLQVVSAAASLSRRTEKRYSTARSTRTVAISYLWTDSVRQALAD